jgi:nicotianamine synthase
VTTVGAPADALHVVIGPTAAAGTADTVVALHAQLDRLVRVADLEPGELVDSLFTALVDICAHCSEQQAAAVLSDPRIRALMEGLRHLCAEGEFRLERFWAGRIAAAADPDGQLALFPYLGNYQALTALELGTLAGLGSPAAPSRVCVLGSGPLPLTALLTARALNVPVDAVDLDAEATELAGAALRALQGGDLVRVHQADARDFPGIADADVVLLAALVGLDHRAKHEVIAAVSARMRPGALLVVRGAHRLRTLLYPPLSPDDLAAAGGGRLTPLVEVRPFNDVVNSLVVAVRT